MSNEERYLIIGWGIGMAMGLALSAAMRYWGLI